MFELDQFKNAPLLSLLLATTFNSYATSEQEKNNCLLTALRSADNATTVEEIKKSCNELSIKKEFNMKKIGAISNRIINERRSEFNPYVMTPHKMNYILPASITDKINTDAYSEIPNFAEHFENIEAKFQLSIKVPLNSTDLFNKGDALYFGFTLQSWWQIYSDNISKPFKETNYQPEIFYFTPINWHPFDGNTGIVFGAEHQSNGRSQVISRSWNRVYVNFLYEKGDFALSFRPWIRLPEDEKKFPTDPKGDDNPDILDYMGHFELGMVYEFNDKYELSFKGRENFAEHHGSIELGVTFPLWGKLKGYAQYINGYGESLIDYNHKQQRFGIGIALTEIL